MFDDENIETEFIEGCLKDAKENIYNSVTCEETRQASITALEAMLPLTEDKRKLAIDLAFKYLYF